MRQVEILLRFLPFGVKVANLFRSHYWENSILKEVITAMGGKRLSMFTPNANGDGNASSESDSSVTVENPTNTGLNQAQVEEPEPSTALTAQEKVLAQEFRELLQELGPVFVKFGQCLSIRPDIVPPTALQELQGLCDSVPAFPDDVAADLVEQELTRGGTVVTGSSSESGPGNSSKSRSALISHIVSELRKPGVKPIAAASLGQVYRVSVPKKLFTEKELLDLDDNTVFKSKNETIDLALKVQRPDMLKSISLDLYVLRSFLLFIENTLVPKIIVPNLKLINGDLGSESDSKPSRSKFMLKLLDSFTRASYSELDYLHEALQQELFRKQLVPKVGANKLKIPKVFGLIPESKSTNSEDSESETSSHSNHSLITTRKVLCSEFIEGGRRIAECSSDEINAMVPIGTIAYLTMLLDTGRFHGDPHQGNLMVQPIDKNKDTNSGKNSNSVDNVDNLRLVLLDFGLTSLVDHRHKKHMAKAILHLTTGNSTALIKDFGVLGFLPREMFPPGERPTSIYESGTESDDEKSTNSENPYSANNYALYRNLLKDADKVFLQIRHEARNLMKMQNLMRSMKETVENKVKPVRGAKTFTLRRKKLQVLSRELNQIFFDYPFTVPEYLALITRALITLEGLALKGDEDFDIFQHSFKPTREIATKLFGKKEVALMLMDEFGSERGWFFE